MNTGSGKQEKSNKKTVIIMSSKKMIRSLQSKYRTELETRQEIEKAMEVLKETLKDIKATLIAEIRGLKDQLKEIIDGKRK